MLERLLDRLRARWRALRYGSDLDRELAREIDAHIEDQIAENILQGMSPEEARRAARRQFGLRESIAEECREARGVSFVENVVRDLKYGWRALVRQPMLLVAAAASIGIGVAANLSVYALANDLLLSVPSAADPGRLIHVRTGNGSHASYAAWRELHGSGAIAGIAGYTIGGLVNLQIGDATTTVTPLIVTPNFFEVVGVPLARGRGFTTSEASRDRRLAVVSDVFIRRHLADATEVVGRALRLNGDPYTVIGILPAGVRSLPGYGVAPDIYVIASESLLPAMNRPTVPVLQLIGRLAEGQSVAQARDALAAAAVRIGKDIGDREMGASLSVTKVGGFGQIKDFAAVGAFFVVLLAVSLLVLSIACANVAGLLLARSLSRGREIAMRVALGAGRRRLLQQLMTESLLLALVGSAVGVGLTWIVARAIEGTALPLTIPIRIQPVIDLRLCAAGGGLVVLTTMLCGVVPAVQATRPMLLPSIRQEPTRYMSRRFTVRRLLVVGQVAISALLLMVALLFVRNLQHSVSADPGFDADRLVVAHMTFVEGRQGGPGARRIEDVVERIRGVPGVESAAHAEGVPLTLSFGAWKGNDLRFGESGSIVHAEYARNRVGPDYFRTMGIAVRGRVFTEQDRLGAPRVAIVNEEFARRYFGDRDPIGLEIADPRDPQAGPQRVIGLAANSKYRMIGEATAPALYEPLLQHEGSERRTHVVVRIHGSAGTVIPAVRQAMLEVDRTAALAIEPMSSALAFAFLPSRLGAALLGTLGALGTLLAMVGLYGILSFSVSRRTREIGLRMSLGASRSAVTRLVMGEAGLLVCLGLALGLAVALFVTRPLAAFLVSDLETSDPASLTGTLVALVALSLIAAWPPTRRAIRIDPTQALRHD
jgi:putative ABC transport system permease protein